MDEDTVDSLLATLAENDTDTMIKTGQNFGNAEEYFCLYLQEFFYSPWWHMESISFRPFRNVRIFRKYGNFSFQKVGYYKKWLLEPEFTKQLYADGQPCTYGAPKNKTSTLVTFICGADNRILQFKETKKCKYYELLFSSPFNCPPDVPGKYDNSLAISEHGDPNFDYMHFFVIAMVFFCIFFALCLIVKKKRIY